MVIIVAANELQSKIDDIMADHYADVQLEISEGDSGVLTLKLAGISFDEDEPADYGEIEQSSECIDTDEGYIDLGSDDSFEDSDEDGDDDLYSPDNYEEASDNRNSIEL